MSNKEEIRAVASQWIDVIFTGHGVDAIDDLHAEDCVRHDVHSPLKGREACKAPCLARPSGAFRKRCRGVAILVNTTSIPCGSRLTAALSEGSESQRINRTGH